MTLPFLLARTQDLMISEGEEEENEEYEKAESAYDVINPDKEYHQNEIINTSMLSFPSESNERFNPWKSNEKSSSINISSSSLSPSSLSPILVIASGRRRPISCMSVRLGPFV